VAFGDLYLMISTAAWRSLRKKRSGFSTVPTALTALNLLNPGEPNTTFLLLPASRRSKDRDAYEASSCGFVLSDEAEAMKIACWVLAPTKMEKSVEQRKHKNDDRDADDVLEKLRGHVLAGNRLPTVWVPDQQTRDDRELIRARLDLGEKQTQI